MFQVISKSNGFLRYFFPCGGDGACWDRNRNMAAIFDTREQAERAVARVSREQRVVDAAAFLRIVDARNIEQMIAAEGAP